MIHRPDDLDRLRAVWRAAVGDDPDDTSTGWRVTNDAGGTQRIYVFGMIGGWRMRVDEIVKAVHAATGPRIDVHVNSPGGFVYDGVSIYEALRQHPARVVAHVDGLAGSAASFVVQAADERIMGLGSRMVIHDAQGAAYGSPAEIRAAADLADQVSDDIAAMYAERAGGDAATWRAAMSATTSYSASQAVAAGLADRVATRPTTGPDTRTRIIQARHRALTTQGG